MYSEHRYEINDLRVYDSYVFIRNIILHIIRLKIKL